MTLLESLIENNSILLKQKAETWEEAVNKCIKPLVDAGAVEQRYLDAIIKKTNELGPFYILAPGLAMPHDRPESGVIKDSFSFITLEKPVVFPDGQEVDILIGLAATSSDIHNEEAIPQIVMLFDDEAAFEKIRKAESTDEIIELLK